MASSCGPCVSIAAEPLRATSRRPDYGPLASVKQALLDNGIQMKPPKEKGPRKGRNKVGLCDFLRTARQSVKLAALLEPASSREARFVRASCFRAFRLGQRKEVPQ